MDSGGMWATGNWYMRRDAFLEAMGTGVAIKRRLVPFNIAWI